MHWLQCTENTPSTGWCWIWREREHRTPSVSSPPMVRSTNLFFPIRSNVLVYHIFTIHHTLCWMVLCTCTFHGGISPCSHLCITSRHTPRDNLWLQRIAQSFAIRRFDYLSFFQKHPTLKHSFRLPHYRLTDWVSVPLWSLEDFCQYQNVVRI